MGENKKIDLDAPLISIRRFSVEPAISSSSSATTSNSNSNSTNQAAHRRSSLPFYKPDIKSGPVSNPGVIPFVWEQRPGQPKPGANSSSRSPVVAPRPPPVKLGSSVRTRKHVTNYSSSVKEINNLYFESERLEGKQEQIKEEEKFDQRPQVVLESVQAKPRRDTSNGYHETPGREKEKQKEEEEEEKEKEIKKEERKQKENEMREEEEEEEDRFSDALDTLSRTESFFMNCSVSGLSELPVGSTKHFPLPGGSENDARDFMIGRFLPAAQAVATGSPQYTFRKAPVPGRELAKPAQSIVGTGINPSQRRVPVPLPYQNQPKYEHNFEEEEEKEEEEEEEEDDEEGLDESRRFYAKGCGFLPRFCMKGSFLIMNPVPGVKGRGKAAQPRGGARRRTGSPLIRSSNNGSASKQSDEAFENYMHSWEPVYKHKHDQRSNSSMKINESSKNVHSETSHLTYWSDSPNTGGGSSPFIHSTGEVTSPPFHASNGDDRSNNDSRSNSLEKIGYKSSPAVASHYSSQNGSGWDPEPFLDAQESNPSEVAWATEGLENVAEREVLSMKSRGTEERENVDHEGRENVVKNKGVDRVLPLPLQLPKSPTESWLSRTLPSVSLAKKQPVPSFLGIQVQNKKHGLRENEMKPSGPRQIRFCEVLEKPVYAHTEI